MFSVAGPLTSDSKVAYPREEKTRVAGKLETSISKLPSKSVVVPVVVPLTTTFAAGNGRPLLASVTLPLIMPCENTTIGIAKNNNRNILLNKVCLIFMMLRISYNYTNLQKNLTIHHFFVIFFKRLITIKRFD